MGRIQERFFVTVGGEAPVEVDYREGFEADGKVYAFRTHVPTGTLEVVNPETGKRIRLGKTGGRVDLDAWKKLPAAKKGRR